MHRLLLTVWIVITGLGISLIAISPEPLAINNNVQIPEASEIPQPEIIDGMPIDNDPVFAMYGSGQTPQEQRGPEFRKYMAVGLKISVSGGSGSGTIVYYDPKDGYAYIQSCGHLWQRGKASPEEALSKNMQCEVQTWYQNDQKLSTSKKYRAQVLWYYNIRGIDSSLLRFKPDWVPNYFPIAPANYLISKGDHLHSVGCDGGREIAHYDVEVVGERAVGRDNYDLITQNNSPRPGRSGGGLLSTDGYYVGICWGTSDVSGNGIGLFTPLKTIREMNEKNGYGWINNVNSNSAAQMIPIVDQNNPQGTYPKDYIPIPGR